MPPSGYMCTNPSVTWSIPGCTGDIFCARQARKQLYIQPCFLSFYRILMEFCPQSYRCSSVKVGIYANSWIIATHHKSDRNNHNLDYWGVTYESRVGIGQLLTGQCLTGTYITGQLLTNKVRNSTIADYYFLSITFYFWLWYVFKWEWESLILSVGMVTSVY